MLQLEGRVIRMTCYKVFYIHIYIIKRMCYMLQLEGRVIRKTCYKVFYIYIYIYIYICYN